MSIAATREKLLASDDFVIEELKRVQVLYELKRVIRYNHARQQEQHTESDAEHIFGMHCLVDYFLPLEDTKQRWDREQIHLMVQYHELDEIVAGDKISYVKTAADKAAEQIEMFTTLARLPLHMQPTINRVLTDYLALRTPEAKFVKAIDKIEPVFHLYNETGKQTLAYLKTKKDEHDRVKYPYVNDFPVIKRFADVMTEQFVKEGFYHG